MVYGKEVRRREREVKKGGCEEGRRSIISKEENRPGNCGGF